MLYEAIFADLLAHDYRIARMIPKCAFFHYCNIISNAALLDSLYDRGMQVDNLPTRPSSILPLEYTVPKILHDYLRRLTYSMRNSTDKLYLHVPAAVYPQGPLNFDNNVEVPSGSFGILDEENHNIYECYLAPLVVGKIS